MSELVRRHGWRVYRAALRHAPDVGEAEDIVQECFIRLWRHAPDWHTEGSGLVGWLHRITINLCRDRHRRLRLRLVSADWSDERVDPAEGADARLEAWDTQRTLAAALIHLPPQQRQALTLRYFDDQSNAQVARAMGLSVKAVESLLGRARRHLRERLRLQQLEAHDRLMNQRQHAA